MATRPALFEGFLFFFFRSNSNQELGSRILAFFFIGQIQIMPRATKFKYRGIFFRSDGKLEHDCDCGIGAASVVMWELYHTVW